MFLSTLGVLYRFSTKPDWLSRLVLSETMTVIVVLSLSVRAALVFKILKSVWFGNKRDTNIDNHWRINNARALLHASQILDKSVFIRQGNDSFIKHRTNRKVTTHLTYA